MSRCPASVKSLIREKMYTEYHNGNAYEDCLDMIIRLGGGMSYDDAKELMTECGFYCEEEIDIF